jgi:uracil phosphoribosyltransferase
VDDVAKRLACILQEVIVGLMHPNLTVVEHPLVKHKLTLMRRKDTSTAQFRALLSEIALLLGYEAMRDLKLTEEIIETPLMEMKASRLEGKKLVLIAIMRAGQGIVDGLLQLVPSARVGHVGLYRDPKTLQAVEYYYKVPQQLEDRDVLVCDPMLATGNSAIAALDRLKRSHPGSLRLVCLLACPEGIKNLAAAHPDVPIITAAVDERLNDHGYILPGLGDAGDRLFGTK